MLEFARSFHLECRRSDAPLCFVDLLPAAPQRAPASCKVVSSNDGKHVISNFQRFLQGILLAVTEVALQEPARNFYLKYRRQFGDCTAIVAPQASPARYSILHLAFCVPD